MAKPIPFLDYRLPLYEQHLAAWTRDENRLYGGDAVLDELKQWKGESDPDFIVRQGTAGYMPIPKNHTLTLSGHLSKATPMPEFAEMGKVRERSKVDRNKSLAELLWYNVDGIGQDGSEFMPYFDGVNERAMATGYRWILVEMPTTQTLAEIRAARIGIPREDTQAVANAAEGLLNVPFTRQDVLDGFRPFPVEWSPIAVPFWQKTNGRLDMAVARIDIPPTNLVDEALNVVGTNQGYYLLVRRGFRGLGDQWSTGGWWKYDQEHQLLGQGSWDNGEIPMFQFMGEPSPGTQSRPAIARSLTMELGQIAIGLMLLRSGRDYNIMQAAKSVNHVLGIDQEKHGMVLAQQDLGSITVGYPPVMGPDGQAVVPQIWNSSAALLDSQAFESVISSSLDEAREIMVKQVTSTPDSSGRSKEAGFAEATSPLLARLAATRQQALNTFLYFAALRLGIQNPTASVTIPRNFDLQPVVDDIDAMMSLLKKSWLRSPTWESHLLIEAGDERGLIPDDKRQAIEDELNASAVTSAANSNAPVDQLMNTPTPNQPPTNQPPTNAPPKQPPPKAAAA